MMPNETPIEPGQTFLVEYGNEKLVEVHALCILDQIKVSDSLEQMIRAEQAKDPLETIKLFRTSLECVKTCVVNPSDEFLRSIDAQDCIEIATATMAKARVSDEHKKKSESPH